MSMYSMDIGYDWHVSQMQMNTLSIVAHVLVLFFLPYFYGVILV